VTYPYHHYKQEVYRMKLLSWAICVLGLWILLTSILPGQMWVGIVGGLVIAVLALIAAFRKET